MIKELFGQSRKEKLFFSIGVIVNIFSSILTLLIPLLIKKLIDNDLNFKIIFAIIFLGIISTVSLSVSSYMLFSFGEKQISHLRDKLIKKLINAKIKFYDQNNSSRLSSRIINDTENIRNFISHNISDLFKSIVMIIGGATMIFLLDWKLASVIIIGLLLLLLLFTPLSNVNRQYIKERQNIISKLGSLLTENFQQIKMIKASQSEKQVLSLSSELTKQVFNISKRSSLIDALITPLVFLILFTILIVIFTYGGMRVANNTMTTGTLISFFLYLIQLLTPVSSVGNFFNEYAKAKGATEEVMKILKLKTEDALGVYFNKDFNNLEFKDVCFRYNDNEYNLLNDISLNFRKGEKTSIVGPSGSGKSTLVSLIERFYSPVSGFISISDNNIENIDLHNWRSKVTLISQDNSLFSGTIYENLISGLDYKPSDEAVFSSLKKANIYNEIINKEHGINENVGEKGNKLSEGQKQRIQIAKAFLRNTEILILDEATSSLDSESEYKIMKELEEFTNNLILIVIAHRLSTIKDSNNIYFIEGGNITGIGNHKELIENHTGYKKFIANQAIN